MKKAKDSHDFRRGSLLILKHRFNHSDCFFWFLEMRKFPGVWDEIALNGRGQCDPFVHITSTISDIGSLDDGNPSIIILDGMFQVDVYIIANQTCS